MAKVPFLRSEDAFSDLNLAKPSSIPELFQEWFWNRPGLSREIAMEGGEKKI